MNKSFFSIIIFMLAAMVLQAQTPAFPGAGGGGMYTTGGRGGKVLYVTSLDDNTNVGTLRWAIGQSGARTIMFKVSGTIALNSSLRINNGNVTIAGQTAPGDGICIKNYELFVNADNVIIRFIRFRLGNDKPEVESDAIWGRYRKNIIIDQCSMSWSIDECASFYSNENFSLQWCIIAESLNNAGHAKGAHGYGGIWGGKNASFHHNLIAHHNSRNPRFNGWKRSGLSYTNPLDEERVDFRNNVIYNWGDNSSYGGEAAGKYNIVNNYFKYGPATKSNVRSRITQVDVDASSSYGQRHGTYFIEGNFVFGNASVTSNNWSGVSYATGASQANARTTTPFVTTPIAEHTAEVAFDRVLDYAGVSLVRDRIDARIATEARNGTATYSGSVTKRPGIIDNPNDVGGYPTYNTATAPTDSDNDGIPDGWLDTHFPGKKATDLNAEGYTYLEVYINSFVSHIVEARENGAVVAGIFNNKWENANFELKTSHDKSNGRLTLVTDTRMLTVRLLDISGRIIAVYTPNDERFEINTSHLSASVYIISVLNANNEQKTIKFVM